MKNPSNKQTPKVKLNITPDEGQLICALILKEAQNGGESPALLELTKKLSSSAQSAVAEFKKAKLVDSGRKPANVIAFPHHVN